MFVRNQIQLPFLLLRIRSACSVSFGSIGPTAMLRVNTPNSPSVELPAPGPGFGDA